MRKYTYIIAALLVLVLLNYLIFKNLIQNRYKWIIIHHSASKFGNYALIKDFHLKKHGWRDAAYHLILSNGSTNISGGHLEATNRYKFLSYSLATKSPKHNIWGINICVVGNYESNQIPNDLRLYISSAVELLQKRYRISNYNILFHRDIGSTLCPGRYLRKEDILAWKDKLKDCPQRIIDQQTKVIGDAQYSVHTLSIQQYLLFIIPSFLYLFIAIKGYTWLINKQASECSEISNGKISDEEKKEFEKEF